MGGIAGLVCLKHCADEVHTKLVEQMCNQQAHRGPDGQGIVSMGRVCLGSAGLDTLDLSNTGRQPFKNEDGSLCITYDGTIYNYLELREQLALRGHSLRSKTDTEAALHAFKEWGEKSFDRLIGMFAFAVYDRFTDTLTLVRDHFGVKPLHYAVADHHLVFASEIKALLAVWTPQHPNRRALVEWFFYRDVMPQETLFEGIWSIPPGHVLEIRGTHVAPPRAYYTPIAHVDPALYKSYARKSTPEMVGEIDNAVQKSIQECVGGEVPVGVMLSGGVDSALIAAIATRHKAITAFHVSIRDDPLLDERPYAEEVAKRLEIPLVCYTIDRAAFGRELAHAIYLNEMPLMHMQCVAFHLLMQQAHEHDVKVLLSGDSIGALLGAEWGRHRRQKWLHRLQALIKHLPPKLSKALEIGIYAYKGMPVTAPGFEGLLPQAVNFLDRYARLGYRIHCEQAYAFVSDRTERAILATKLADLSQWLLRFFHRGDRLGMGASVEYRLPFQDIRSVHMAINLPLAFNIRAGTGKWGLKQAALRYLPREIAFRKKVAWDLPAKAYLAPMVRHSFFQDGFCAEILGLNAAALDQILMNWQENLPMFFNLINLEIWGRLYFLHQSPQELTEKLLYDLKR